MQFKISGVTVRIDYLLLTLIALFSFFDNGKIMLLALSTAFIHELGHIFAAEIVGSGVKELYFTAIGIRMKTKVPLHLLSLVKKLIVLSSGCLINMVMCIVFYISKQNNAALFHLVTAVFNILPVGTLDGGRILTEILSTRLEIVHSEKICDIISIVLSVFLFVLGACVLIHSGYNFSLIITSFYLVFTVILRQKRLN